MARARRGRAAVGYEDWYLVENWTALGVLEAAAVSRGHAGAHDERRARVGRGTGAVYRLLEGTAQPGRRAHWRSGSHGPAGSGEPQLADLLDDGIDPARSALWQR